MNRQTGLNCLKNIDIDQCEPEQLVDLSTVSIDKTLPVPERMRSFVSQIKNPYLFKVDDITVRVAFSSGKSFEDALLSFLLEEKNR